jgi:hypothetical protein
MNGRGRVQKFRSIEEMNAAAPASRNADFERFLRHCARYCTYPRGVFRFRGIEDAQRARVEARHGSELE